MESKVKEMLETVKLVEKSYSSGAMPFELSEQERQAHIQQSSEAEESQSGINLKGEFLKIVVKKSVRFLDDQALSSVPTYRMRGKCRGLYLGINNMKFVNDVKNYRPGAQVDEENLMELFKQMNFETNSRRDQTKEEMEQTIRDFADVKRNPSLKIADCLVVTIMSHGAESDTIYNKKGNKKGNKKDKKKGGKKGDKIDNYVITSDGRCIGVSWIIEQFSNENCPAFINKPKIFIFQMCRGENPHIGLLEDEIQADGFSQTPGNIIRKMTDMLLAFSTLPGDQSYRNIYKGSWYIQLLCEVFMKHAHDTEIEHLLKMVDQKLETLYSKKVNKQTSTYESRGFKRCFLHPGLSE